MIDDFLKKDIVSFLDSYEESPSKGDNLDPLLSSSQGESSSEDESSSQDSLSSRSFNVEEFSVNKLSSSEQESFTAKQASSSGGRESSSIDDQNETVGVDDKLVQETFSSLSSPEQERKVYTRALAAIANNDAHLAISLLFALVKKRPSYLAYKIRLDEAFALQDVPSRPSTVNHVSVDSLSSISKKDDSFLSSYVKAISTLKSGDKKSALDQLKGLSEQRPKNIALKLRINYLEEELGVGSNG